MVNSAAPTSRGPTVTTSAACAPPDARLPTVSAASAAASTEGMTQARGGSQRRSCSRDAAAPATIIMTNRMTTTMAPA